MSKNKNDIFGNRMKEYEQAEAGRKAIKYLPVCVRIDGKCFSSLAKNMERPFCEELHGLMIKVCSDIMEETGANIGYTQSDEISLIYHNEEINSQLYFDAKFQKLTSVLASIATAVFNEHKYSVPNMPDVLALFDCRAWQVPNTTEAINYLIWRELDATKNSVSMLARCHYSHKQLENKGRSDMMEMLHEKNINWAKYPISFKRGTYIVRVVKKLTAEDLKLKMKDKPQNLIDKALEHLEKNEKTFKFYKSMNLPVLKSICDPVRLLKPLTEVEVGVFESILEMVEPQCYLK